MLGGPVSKTPRLTSRSPGDGGFQRTTSICITPSLCTIVPFGGTVLMALRDGTLAPFYEPLDVALCRYIKDNITDTTIRDNCISLLLQGGRSAYPTIIGNLTGHNGNNVEKFIRDKELLQKLGYNPDCASLGADYKPIDSINYDVDEHYQKLLRTVIAVLNKGEIAIVLGGTDALRFYGTQLALDLKVKGITTPVIIMSSMKAFGDVGDGNQDHVIKLFRVGRKLAHKAITMGLGGVYALVPKDEAVSGAELISLSETPVDKISAHLPRAFRGTPCLAAETEEGVIPPEQLPPPDPQYTNTSAYTRHAVPPLEATNSPEALVRFMASLVASNPHQFKAMVIKGIPEAGDRIMEEILLLTKALHHKGVEVLFVNDPRYHSDTQKLEPMVENFGHHPARHKLEESGAIFLDGMSSTQAYLRACIGSMASATRLQPPPLSTKEESSLAELQTSLKDAPAGLPLALEYVPRKASFKAALKVAIKGNMHDIVIGGFTHGATHQDYATILDTEPFNQLKITVTFKYAGESMDEGSPRETADLAGYQASVALKDSRRVTVGNMSRPTVLMGELHEAYRRAAQKPWTDRYPVSPAQSRRITALDLVRTGEGMAFQSRLQALRNTPPTITMS